MAAAQYIVWTECRTRNGAISPTVFVILGQTLVQDSQGYNEKFFVSLFREMRASLL